MILSLRDRRELKSLERYACLAMSYSVEDIQYPSSEKLQVHNIMLCS
jgi:hypothetical protein